METRKHYSPAFKAQIVQELLREEKTVAQLASEHGIHPTQLHKWRSIAVEAWSPCSAGRTARRRSRHGTRSSWRICTPS